MTKATIGVVTFETVLFWVEGSYSGSVRSSVFWDITSYSSVKVNLCFGGIYRLHCQCQRIRRALLATSFHAGFLELFNFIYVAGKAVQITAN
jgi:hypothetical protein